MSGWLRRHAMMLLGFAVSAVLLGLVFRNTDWAAMAAAFRAANYWFVIAGTLVGFLGFVARALDWKYLLAPVGRFPARRLFAPMAIGYLANNVFPARLGEFVRAYAVGKREGISKSSALASIIVERIFDGLTLLLILAIVSIFFPFPLEVKLAGGVVAAVFLGLSASLALVTLKVRWAMRLVDLTLGRVSPAMAEEMKKRVMHFVAGLNIGRHLGSTALAFLACLFRWFFEACIYFGVVAAMGIHVPPHGVLFVLVAVNILTMIPSGPGYVGTVQAACLLSLGVFGVGKSEAVAFSLLLHAAIYFPITFAGLACLMATHLRLGSLRQAGAVAATGAMKVEASDAS